MDRLKGLKQKVYGSIQLPHGQYQTLDWGVKDFLLRQRGLGKLEEQREVYSNLNEPEFKKFFKDEKVYLDLHQKIQMSQTFMYNKVKEAIKFKKEEAVSEVKKPIHS